MPPRRGVVFVMVVVIVLIMVMIMAVMVVTVTMALMVMMRATLEVVRGRRRSTQRSRPVKRLHGGDEGAPLHPQ